MNKIIDTSSYNGTVDFKEAKTQGVAGAILKIIRKDLTPDNQFYASQKACEANEMPWGVYNYSYATTAKKAEADMKLVCDMLDKLDREHFKLGVWFDIEDSSQAKLSKATIAELLNAAQTVVEARGYSFGIYTGRSFYNEHIDKTKVKCQNWWIARYYKGNEEMPIGTTPAEKYKPLENCWAWQYTSSGTVKPAISAGNKGHLDVSIQYKEFEEEKNMSITIGSARGDERGKISGGKAGDQTGREVSTQSYYLHKKGWRVFRAKDTAARAKIAKAMKAACDNANIGYDQSNRTSLFTAVKTKGYDPAKATGKCETDCSALVRVCCAYAGILLPNFSTYDEAAVLKDSGKFTEVTNEIRMSTGGELITGDILVTKTKGHTAVVTSSPYAEKTKTTTTKSTYPGTFPTLPTRGYFKTGDKGTQVKYLQQLLNWINGGKITVDGEVGKSTIAATKLAQTNLKVTVDGLFGKTTLEATKAYRK